MNNYQQLLLRLMVENKIKEYDTIDLAFYNYCYKHNIDPSIKHNITPTLTTKCNIAVVVEE